MPRVEVRHQHRRVPCRPGNYRTGIRVPIPRGQDLHQAGGTMKKVSGYTLSTCPWCHKTKKYFRDHNIPFQYVDYDLQNSAEQERIEREMKNRGGPLSFPWVLI